MNENGMLAPHPLSIFALRPAIVANVAAAVGFGIGIDDLTVKSRRRNAEPVIVTHHWRRVDNKHNHFASGRFSKKRDDAVVGIMKIDPFESVMTVVLLPQGRLAFVSVFQMLDETSQFVVPWKLGQVPVQALVVIAFVALAAFAAHEEQLFARPSVHPRV